MAVHELPQCSFCINSESIQTKERENGWFLPISHMQCIPIQHGNTFFIYTVYTTTKKNDVCIFLPIRMFFCNPVSTPLQKSKSRLSVQSPSKLITAEKENSGPTSPQLSWWWNGGGDIYPVKISLGMVDVTELGRWVLDSKYIYIYLFRLIPCTDLVHQQVMQLNSLVS